MMLDSPHTSVPILMRGNTPPTTRSPPHRSRPSRKPTQPTTRHSLRGRTGRERPDVEADVDEGGPRLQAATDRAACAAAPHQHQPPPPSTRRSPQRAVPRHGEGGQRLRRTAAPRHTANGGPRPGRAPAAARPAVVAPHATPRPPPTTTGRRKGGCPVVSNRPLHRAMQQRCQHASASAQSPSWPPMPRPHLQRAATARREKVQLPIAEQNRCR
jgi:hypothetical protein